MNANTPRYRIIINCHLQWPLPEEMSDKQLAELLFPTSASKPVYKMPDYAYIHKELQRNGVTLNLLWLEYCDQCRDTGQTPYQSTQFNKYYSDYLAKTNATMHLNHKPGEIMQVDWAGDTASVIDTDTGEIIPAYVFVATLPYCRLTSFSRSLQTNLRINLDRTGCHRAAAKPIWRHRLPSKRSIIPCSKQSMAESKS